MSRRGGHGFPGAGRRAADRCPTWCVERHTEPVGEQVHHARLRVVGLTAMPLIAGKYVQDLTVDLVREPGARSPLIHARLGDFLVARLLPGEADSAGLALVGLAALARMDEAP
ncbi:hypothetical protein OG320_05295 [Microbispora sp. NBC_01189]|uniref:hypothetical protein n=1 Tax=Microbispora sp. NBC_01189 TaxID=2903583 RepID=UPI002E0FD3F9|nr:hypothetical protein OG320_05295 [Microbispora sp. NBC_01189]